MKLARVLQEWVFGPRHPIASATHKVTDLPLSMQDKPSWSSEAQRIYNLELGHELTEDRREWRRAEEAEQRI